MNAIPGTPVLVPVYNPARARPPRNTAEAAQRRGLLAMIHIAKKDLALTDDEYRLVLGGMRAISAAELSIPQMERLIKYLGRLGWKPVRSRRRKKRPADDDLRLDALRRRCVEVAQTLANGEKRLAGLAVKICGVASLTWCRDAAKLERLLAVLGSIGAKECQ